MIPVYSESASFVTRKTAPVVVDDMKSTTETVRVISLGQLSDVKFQVKAEPPKETVTKEVKGVF